MDTTIKKNPKEKWKDYIVIIINIIIISNNSFVHEQGAQLAVCVDRQWMPRQQMLTLNRNEKQQKAELLSFFFLQTLKTTFPTALERRDTLVETKIHVETRLIIK